VSCGGIRRAPRLAFGPQLGASQMRNRGRRRQRPGDRAAIAVTAMPRHGSRLGRTGREPWLRGSGSAAFGLAAAEPTRHRNPPANTTTAMPKHRTRESSPTSGIGTGCACTDTWNDGTAPPGPKNGARWPARFGKNRQALARVGSIAGPGLKESKVGPASGLRGLRPLLAFSHFPAAAGSYNLYIERLRKTYQHFRSR